MSIDKQRVHAVEVLQRLGHRWDGSQWISPAPIDELAPVADALHGILMDRAERLAGSLEDSDEEAELEAISNALEAYELGRWPLGRVPGGKG